MPEILNPLNAIRKHCLDCAGLSSTYVKWCPCDGRHADRCELWPYRFGIRPETARKRYGDEFVDPERMPQAIVPLEEVAG